MSVFAPIDQSHERKKLALTLASPGLPVALVEQGQVAAILRTATDEDLDEAATSLIALLDASPAFTRYHSGEDRAVFSCKGYGVVIKVPYGQSQACINQLEAAYYEQDAYGHAVVPCRLLWTAQGLPLVLMEEVDVQGGPDLPAWAALADGGQVARSTLLEGQWAAYDAGWPAEDSTAFQKDRAVAYDYRRLVSSDMQIWPKDAD